MKYKNNFTDVVTKSQATSIIPLFKLVKLIHRSLDDLLQVQLCPGSMAQLVRA